MNFREWLLESNHDKDSWQDPNGNFHPTQTTHGGDASRIVASMNLPIPVPMEKHMEYLFNLGWMRVWNYEKELIVNNPVKVPNFKQKRALINLALEHKMIIVLYDNGVATPDDQTVLWSPQDTL